MATKRKIGLKKLRERHDCLVFERWAERFEQEKLVVEYFFTLEPGIKIRNEVWFKEVPKERYEKIKGKALDNLFFNLGMGELMLMWRFACPKNIVIRAGYLNTKQIKFWKKLFIEGFGEFYFREKINFKINNFLKFKVEAKKRKISLFREKLKERDLLLTTGGKDSAVSMEIMRKSQREIACLLVEPKEAAWQNCQKAGVKTMVVERREDLVLAKLVEAGYFNGHTPYTLYLALVSTLAAGLYDYKNILVSNEESSNEANTIYLGTKINHQYAKSMVMENNFREYSRLFLSTETNFFSFLRPLGELQIGKLFAEMSDYYQTFRSCNVGAERGVWCLNCPKCLSVYLCLYPFMGYKLDGLFGERFLDKMELLSILEGLMGVKGRMKPLECVATIREIRAAVFLSRERAKKEGRKPFWLLEEVAEYELNDRSILKEWNEKHNLPKVHEGILRKAYLGKIGWWGKLKYRIQGSYQLQRQSRRS